jgi:2'-5' RNA ligase
MDTTTSTMPVEEDDADDDDYDKVMIALFPIVSDWCAIDIPHLTLVYCGAIADLKPTDFNDMAKACSELACLSNPITLMVTGRSQMGDPPEDPVDVFTLRPTQQLMAMRSHVDDWDASTYPDFKPHVTIGPVGTPVDLTPKYIAFDRLAVCWGVTQIIFSLRGGNYGSQMADSSY